MRLRKVETVQVYDSLRCYEVIHALHLCILPWPIGSSMKIKLNNDILH